MIDTSSSGVRRMFSSNGIVIAPMLSAHVDITQSIRVSTSASRCASRSETADPNTGQALRYGLLHGQSSRLRQKGEKPTGKHFQTSCLREYQHLPSPFPLPLPEQGRLRNEREPVKKNLRFRFACEIDCAPSFGSWRDLFR